MKSVTASAWGIVVQGPFLSQESGTHATGKENLPHCSRRTGQAVLGPALKKGSSPLLCPPFLLYVGVLIGSPLRSEQESFCCCQQAQLLGVEQMNVAAPHPQELLDTTNLGALNPQTLQSSRLFSLTWTGSPGMSYECQMHNLTATAVEL